MADETVEQPDPVPADTQEIPVESLPLPDDRPARNALAEMQRKYTKIERQNAEILAAMQTLHAQQQQARQAPPPATGSEYTDEQLSQLAAAGNAEAINLLVARKAAQQTNAHFSQFTQVQTLQQALGQLFARYPMLRTDPNHPLTQAVYQARHAFLASGWQPGLQTDLEAIKAAIVNAPHLAHAPQPSPDTTRRAGVNAQQSVDGAAPRRSPQTQQTQAVRPLDKKVAELAKRYGTKDPHKALKNFIERQQDGTRSTLSPIIQQAVREEQT